MALEGFTEKLDIAAVVAKTAELVTQQTIDIPRILVVPEGEVKTGFRSFTLDLTSLNYPAVSDELWIQHLRTNELEVLALGKGGIEEARLEDYVVSGLIDFDEFPTMSMPICSTNWLVRWFGIFKLTCPMKRLAKCCAAINVI